MDKDNVKNHSSSINPTQSRIPHHAKEPGPFEMSPPQQSIEQLHFTKMFETGGTNTPIEMVNVVTVDEPSLPVLPTVNCKKDVDESSAISAPSTASGKSLQGQEEFFAISALTRSYRGESSATSALPDKHPSLVL